MRRPWMIAAAASFTVFLLAGVFVGDRVLALTDDARDILRAYTELVTVAHDQYGEDVSYRELVFSSINGMLRTLDPHSSFLSPDAYSNMRDRQKSSFHGLGILVGSRNGQLTVITPLQGTPASRLGIRAGDVINTIEGELTEAMSVDEAVRRLKGPKGTQVRITIVRTGLDEPLEFTITRDSIPQNTVRNVYMIGPETGYLTISDFNRGTGREVADALDELREAGMERLLLDLRDNGGGLLDQAIAVADLFLPDGAKIVETRGRTRDSFQEYRATERKPPLGIPVVVLVNNGTASAAEILAGAIQDHDIGLIVGTATWGKGLVQTVYTLSYDAGIALTTAKYYTPSGRLIQRDYTSWFDYVSNGENDGVAGPVEIGATEIFRTDLGREVYGGGGITPDISIDRDELSAFLQFLLSRNTFFDFAIEYTSRRPVETRTWRPDDKVVDEYLAWLVEKEIVTPEELDKGLAEEGNRAVAQRFVHAEVFTAAFGMDARQQVLAEGDNQVQRALEVFGEASELLARRLGLTEDASPAIGL